MDEPSEGELGLSGDEYSEYESSEDEYSESLPFEDSPPDDNPASIQFGTLNFRDFLLAVEIKKTECLCYNIKNQEDMKSVLNFMKNINPLPKHLNCVIDNLTKSYNLLVNCNAGALNLDRLYFADLFYRIRHEHLCKKTLEYLNLDVTKSDTKFTKFGIESNRTPDYIIDINSTILVLEISATSSYERASIEKGVESLGFESKYKRELDIMRDKGMKFLYAPVIFDMSNPGSQKHFDELSKLEGLCNFSSEAKTILGLYHSSFCHFTLSIKNFLVAPSNILFTNFLPIEKDHSNLEFLYKNEQYKNPFIYKDIYVQSNIYSRVNSNWHRFGHIFNFDDYQDSKSYTFYLDTQDYRFKYTQDNNGVKYDLMCQYYQDNNKLEFYKNLKLKLGYAYKDCLSDVGVKYTERANSKNLETSNYDVFLLHSSHNSQDQPFAPYKKEKLEQKLKVYMENNYSPVYFDPTYEDKLMKCIEDYDESNIVNNNYILPENVNLLASMPTKNINIDKLTGELKQHMLDLNKFDDGLPLKVKHLAPPFIIPLADLSFLNYSSLDHKNIDLINSFIFSIKLTDPYTSEILFKILDPEFVLYEQSKPASSELNKLYERRREISRELTLLYKNHMNNMKNTLDFKNKKLPKLQSVEFSELKVNVRNLDKDIISKEKQEGVRKNISFIKAPTKNKNSNFGMNFQAEMSHFKNKKVQSYHKGIGLESTVENDYENNLCVFNELTDVLTDFRGLNPDMLMDTKVYEDCNLLKGFKMKHIDNYKNLYEEVKNSALGHAAAFVSRLSHSLMFYSQMAFNSDYVRVDNLGYSNVLLLVRGGKKIFKSKSSKLFRLFYPINPLLKSWYLKPEVKCNYNWLNINGVDYILTPWQMFHETILTDSISFYTRLMSFCILNSNPALTFKKQFCEYSLNVLLAFHNRRKTEVLLSNLRYILFSNMGEFTGLDLILPEFCGFNHDCFQSFVRTAVVNNYSKYYFKPLMALQNSTKKLSLIDFRSCEIRNLFSGAKIASENSLSLMIYSTFLMSKAPYQKLVERANNLESVLEIHRSFDNEVGLNLSPEEQMKRVNVECKDNLGVYVKQLFENDFKIDVKYLSSLGAYADSLFINKNVHEKFQPEWTKILNRPWDGMATSTGLRGDPEDLENFWGKKGYFVVYKELLKDVEFVNNLDLLLSEKELNFHEMRKKLRGIQQTQMDNNIKRRDKGLNFHIVDKVQWKGSREIYVMDINTKSKQQPIESFMGYLCSQLDNELISIPSDKRSQVIHHAIFEKDIPGPEILTYYLTLDCSKWAPKSIFIKFAITLLAMATVPSTFKTHFFNYLSKLYTKKIYCNKGEYETLLKNPNKNKNLTEFVKHDVNLNGYYLEMPYSWVMGIFNYTSSFLHAINQQYANYLISKTCYNSLKEDCSMVMFAHSDDSGGRLCAPNQLIVKRNLFLYEVNLKACNHTLSKKKCAVSKIYFELLSILYVFKRLLALLPKFLGGLRFLPTDKGVCQDMLQTYSKTIEVLVAGASFEQAYLVSKFYSMMVWRFYHNVKPRDIDYTRPVQYLGMPDAHPLSVLINGSNSDIIRILHTQGEAYVSNLMAFVNKICDPITETGPIRPLKFNINIRGLKGHFAAELINYKEHLDDWSVKNVSFNSTPFNMLSFLSKLQDKGFVGSLMNESLTRRISRAYYFRNSNTLVTKILNINFKLMKDAIDMFQVIIDTENQPAWFQLLEIDPVKWEADMIECKIHSDKQVGVLKSMLSSSLKIMGFMDSLTLEGKEYQTVERTLKPTHLQIMKTGKVFSTNFDPPQLVSYCKNSKFTWALPNLETLQLASLELKQLTKSLGFNIDDLDEATLLMLCQNYTRKDVKDIYLYSQTPSELRIIKTYSGLLSFLATNSFTNKEVSGLTLNLGKNLHDPSYVNTQLGELTYQINTVLLLFTILSKHFHQSAFADLNIKPSVLVGWHGGRLTEFLDWVENMRKDEASFGLLNLPLRYCSNFSKTPGEILANCLEGGYFYTFIKDQKSKDVWRGEGILLFQLDQHTIILELYNDRVLSVKTNLLGKLDLISSAFLLDTMLHLGIKFKPSFLKNSGTITTQNCFGFDYLGDVYNGPKRELSCGVESVTSSFFTNFLLSLHRYKLNYNKNNLFILSPLEPGEDRNYKIYCLHPTVTSINMVAQEILDRQDFEGLCMREGFDDLTDFIYTEVLTQFGLENTVSYEDFFDNYVGSKLYRIVNYIQKNNPELIPTKMLNDIGLPSPEGSLSRAIYTYEYSTQDYIINTKTNVNSEMLRLRNEYPEKFSLLMYENLEKSYNNLYSRSEKAEIRNSYNKISQIDDPKTLQANLVKLMCYWGYSAVVNTVETYTFDKQDKNYLIFKYPILDKLISNFYLTVIPDFIKNITSTVLEYSYLEKGLNYPVEFLRPTSIETAIRAFTLQVSYNCYSYNSPFRNISVWVLTFYNLLLAMMDDDNFCESLENKFKDTPAINTLPINSVNKNYIICLMNSLTLEFYKSKKLIYALDGNAPRELLPTNITQPKVIHDSLSNTRLPGHFVYHHGLLEVDFCTSLKGAFKFNIGRKIYKINVIPAKLSKTLVPLYKEKPFKRPLNEEFLDSEIWEEMESTLKTDYDESEITDLLEEEKIKYDPTQTLKVKNEIRGLVHLVVCPMSEHSNIITKLRQTGENLVVFSSCYIKNFESFYNSHTRVVSNNGNWVFVHITCHSLLHNELWEKYIGGTVIKNVDNWEKSINPTLIVDIKGNVKNLLESGVSMQELFKDLKSPEQMEKEKAQKEEELRALEEANIERQKSESQASTSSGLNEIDFIKRELETKKVNNQISEKLYKKLRNNLQNLDSSGAPVNTTSWIKTIIDSINAEDIKNIITDQAFLGELDLENRVKMFQAPQHFGMAKSGFEIKENIIKDSKVKAELHCLSKVLTNLALSGQLSMSKAIKKKCLNSMKLCLNFIKTTQYKNENKRFLVILFLMIANDSCVDEVSENDNDWSELIFKVINSVADDGEEEESDSDYFKLRSEPHSSIKYQASGYPNR